MFFKSRFLQDRFFYFELIFLVPASPGKKIRIGAICLFTGLGQEIF